MKKMTIIQIRDIDVKASGMVVVRYDEDKEATMNMGWQEQEIKYLQNDVCIGGKVDVLLQEKPNPKDATKPYNNIKQVDMTSASKGIEQPKEPITKTTQASFVGSTREQSIVAQVILKGAIELANVGKWEDADGLKESINTSIGILAAGYKEALKQLE